MTNKEKAPRTEYDQINLYRDTPKAPGTMKKRFTRHWHEHCSTAAVEPTQGEFLMMLLDVWENKEVC